MGSLEIAAFNVASALIAQEYGAHRVELCRDMSVGGLTPFMEDVRMVRSNLDIDLYVMIRPRSGNFCYTSSEFEEMKIAINELKKLGVDGFVFGVLDSSANIDIERNKELVKLATPLPCTFHRAFDRTSNWQESLETIINCGFSTVLTSGMKSNAMEGREILKQMITVANSRITIMPGGGLRSENAALIKQITGAVYFHSSAVVDTSEKANGEEIQKILSSIKE